jgi:hypothetical protein
MKKHAKKFNNKENSKTNNSKPFHFKKEVETVLKLTMKPYNEKNYKPFNTPSKVFSLSPIKKNIRHLSTQKDINSNVRENNNNNMQYDKYRKELNMFSDSLRQLKVYFPNNTEIKELEKSIGVMAPARLEHIKLENNLKDQISELDLQIDSFKSTKDVLEAELVDLDKQILDQQLNKEVSLEMEKENNNKLMKDKLIAEMQNQYMIKDKDMKNKKKSLSSSREFQEKYDLFMKREEYLTKQKEKEIEKDIINKKEKKKNIVIQLNGINDNLKDLHKIRNFFLQKLYEHYLIILKDGKDTRNEGLSWVIREIFALDKKVMLSYLPIFLDKLCIKYIFDMTHLNIKITEVENEIKKTKEEFKKVGIINKGDKSIINESIMKNNQQTMDINEITQNYWEKIREIFGKNSKFGKNNHSILKQKGLNNIKEKTPGRSFKKLKTFFNLPFVAGDPNALSIGNQDFYKLNKLLKDGQKQTAKIPDVLKIKDYAKITNNSGYFLNSDEVKKVQNYLSLKSQLNNLRKKKEKMKTNEMTRIFKEFQRNDYENRFNVDKITVISALIGEDNLNSELVKQSKREKKYIDAIMKGRLHMKMKSVDKAMMEKNILGETTSTGLNGINQMVKSMDRFEVKKTIDLDGNKGFHSNHSQNYAMTF